MDAEIIDAAFVRRLKLPQPEEGSKEGRGRICIIGGSRDVPGAVLLAGMGALRAGGGKLKIATVQSRAAALGMAMPEAMVIGLPETAAGGIACDAVGSFADRFATAHAILVGPGMVEEPECDAILERLIAMDTEAVLIVDAGALPRIMDHRDVLQRWAGRVIITPHAGEMANLLGVEREEVEAAPADAARRLADEFGLVVVMKGGQTTIATPDGMWRYEGGGVGLATSGSGDVLAGIITGLAARGARAVDAAIWGVFLHGEAGTRLASDVGPLGFLAREIPDRVPRLLAEHS